MTISKIKGKITILNNMIFLYSLSSCSKCLALKNQLEKEGIEFKVIDDIGAIQDEMYKANTMSIPFVQIGNEYITEPSITKIKENTLK